jgi:hypothetical protein
MCVRTMLARSEGSSVARTAGMECTRSTWGRLRVMAESGGRLAACGRATRTIVSVSFPEVHVAGGRAATCCSTGRSSPWPTRADLRGLLRRPDARARGRAGGIPPGLQPRRRCGPLISLGSTATTARTIPVPAPLPSWSPCSRRPERAGPRDVRRRRDASRFLGLTAQQGLEGWYSKKLNSRIRSASARRTAEVSHRPRESYVRRRVAHETASSSRLGALLGGERARRHAALPRAGGQRVAADAAALMELLEPLAAPVSRVLKGRRVLAWTPRPTGVGATRWCVDIERWGSTPLAGCGSPELPRGAHDLTADDLATGR